MSVFASAAPIARLRPTEVLLLRDVPEERRLSMERFADELGRGFDGHLECRVTATTVRVSTLAARLGLQRIDRYFTRFVRYPFAVCRLKTDIYHIIDQGYADLAAVLPAERTVVTCHDLMLLRADEGIAGFRGRRLSVSRFRWSTSYLKKVAHVVCDSRATKADLIRLQGAPEERISVVPLGVDERFRSLGEETSRRLKTAILGIGRHAVLHVSTGDPYKNVRGTLTVIAEVRKSGLDVTLVRAGHPLRPDEQALARDLGLDGSVVECGVVSDAGLVELYNACDVLLFPSYYEGFGWPALEAMACGTPVVTSNCPALAELVGDAGLMAAPDDIVSLAASVRAILESQDLSSRLRRRGLERAAGYSWKQTIASYARVYQEVAERGAAWGPHASATSSDR